MKAWAVSLELPSEPRAQHVHTITLNRASALGADWLDFLQPGCPGSTEIIADSWRVYDVGFGTKPSFDFDSNGRLHVMGMTEEFSGVVWYDVADGPAGPWNPRVVRSGYFYGPGDLRVAANGTAHLAWHNHDQEDPNHLTVDPQGNETFYGIPSPGHNGWDNALAFDSAGNVHQTSVNPSGFGAITSLEHGVFDGSSWTYEQVANSGSFMYGLNTSVAIDGQDQPHVVFCQCSDWTSPGDLKYAYEDAQGWHVSTVATNGIRGRFPTIALDALDRPHVTWIDVDENDVSRGFVQYAVMEQGEWTSETIDSLDNIQFGFSGARKLVSLALDNQGEPRVAYGDQRVVKYATRSANDWSATTIAEASQDQYNGLVVLRLNAEDTPAIAFWQSHTQEAGLVRLASPSTFAWNIDATGDWNMSANWSPNGVPHGDRIAAVFGSAITQPADVVIDTAVQVKAVVFDNSNSYRVRGIGTVNLESSSGNTRIEVLQGKHQIQTDVTLHSDTDIEIASESSLVFENALNSAGNTLTKQGDGTMVINATINLGGGMLSILAGTLSGGGSLGGDVANENGTISPGDVVDLASRLHGGGSVAADFRYAQLQSSEITNLDGRLAVVTEPCSLPLWLLGVVAACAPRRRRSDCNKNY